MKKIATVLVFVCMAAGVYAQGLSVGAKLGLNLSNQIYKSDVGTNSPNFLPTYHVGGYLTFMFSEHLGIQPEVLLMGQGAKNGDYKVKMSYIAIPVMVRFDVNKVLSFHAGPQISVLASAKSDFAGTKTDIKDDFSSTDLGVGVGTTISVKKLNFTARFIQGLSNIIADPGANNEKAKNVTLQISVGYTFIGGND